MNARNTLCLGEALVDLICQRQIEDLAEADAFVPSFGGAVANVAVVYALGDRIERAVHDAAALFISSNTMVGAEERAVTMRARERWGALD